MRDVNLLYEISLASALAQARIVCKLINRFESVSQWIIVFYVFIKRWTTSLVSSSGGPGGGFMYRCLSKGLRSCLSECQMLSNLFENESEPEKVFVCV